MRIEMTAIALLLVIGVGSTLYLSSKPNANACKEKAAKLDTEYKIVNGRCYLKGWGTSL